MLVGVAISALVWCNFIVLGTTINSIHVGVYSENGVTPSWYAIKENTGVDLHPVETNFATLSEIDSFGAINLLCQAACSESGISAVFGPNNLVTASAFESVCSHLGIPFISTRWRPRQTKKFETTFNFYPDSDLLSQGLAAIIESLDWDRFAILYENKDSLLKLQDVLKLQEYKQAASKNSIVLEQLDPGWDNRFLLKHIRNSAITRIVLDCSVDKILDVLTQAKEDAHTLDFSQLDTKSNITTMRLFDPSDPFFSDRAGKYLPGQQPEKITVEAALQVDAMSYIAQALKAIATKDPETEVASSPLFCNSSVKYEDKIGLIRQMQETASADSLTGEINLSRGKRETFQLNVIEIYKPEKPIGIWNSEFPDRVHLTRDKTEREAELQKRLENHNFIVSSRIGGPYLFLNPDPETSGNARYYGYSMDLISEIAKIMNITFQFQITDKNLYANLANDLIERRADLAICDFTITPQRREVIDFSMPFMSLGIGILHKKAELEESDNMYAFLRPLYKTVWMYMATLYLLMSAAIFIIARMSSEDWENPHPCDDNPEELENIWDFKNCLWLTLGSITTQGCDILPKGTCTRIATASWWFFSLIITSSYTANLAAFLTMSKMDDSVDSVEELAKQSKIKYGLVQGASTETFFSHSNNSVYQKMWNTMSNEKPSVFEPDNGRGVDRILSTKDSLYAFFMESTGIEYELERKCELRKIGGLLDSKSYGIGMPLNADYRHSINAAVLQLQESGKLIDLKEKWWKREREGDPCPSSVEVDSDALALANVGGVFLVLVCGIAIAFAIAILEFIWNAYNVSVEEHMSFSQALKAEVKFACNLSVTKKRAKPQISEASSASSAKSADKEKSPLRSIMANAGSFLTINTAAMNKLGSSSRLVSVEPKNESDVNF
ncbi:glutamate receptor ionotropic, kainate 2-like isoform X2 [Cylas formicarius]|uniref:glutamate receptor ionotropic, kainate 2-like isoform X2 n=1 Tax=Cylas formicarius TaxID=197179 RepID=UPI002958BA4B|nr:glutamate receptor ionotropic, kainate 2-like isoform X2 [Cylas formicarius]